MAMSYKQTMYVANQTELPAAADDGQIAIMLDSQTSVTYSVALGTWQQLAREVVFKSSVSVNGKATGSTLVYTLPNTPLYFYPTQIVVRNVNITGTGTVPAVTIGTNATSYNNIATSGLLTVLTSTISVTNGVPQLASYSPPLAGGANIYANVTTSALIYTNYTFKIDILGFYDSTTP